jgi:hypothetical protein
MEVCDKVENYMYETSPAIGNTVQAYSCDATEARNFFHIGIGFKKPRDLLTFNVWRVGGAILTEKHKNVVIILQHF